MDSSLPFRAIAGLGNPGPAYARTYHNAGALALARVSEALRRRERLPLFIPPSSFMNESGIPIARLLRKRGIAPAELLVLHDDTDLPLGSFRYAFGSGSAGHHGIDSLLQTLGTPAFHRIRFGVRPPEWGAKKAGEFVLSPLSLAHLDLLYSAVDDAIVKVIEKRMPPSSGAISVSGN
jgi:PTH1 family peptidyl-tRNA hydrolase